MWLNSGDYSLFKHRIIEHWNDLTEIEQQQYQVAGIAIVDNIEEVADTFHKLKTVRRLSKVIPSHHRVDFRNIMRQMFLTLEEKTGLNLLQQLVMKYGQYISTWLTYLQIKKIKKS